MRGNIGYGLGTWTQLIVNESQETILFKGGQAGLVRPWKAHLGNGEHSTMSKRKSTL